MTSIDTHPTRERTTRDTGLYAAIGVLAMMLISVALNFRIGTNTDVSWIITMTQRLLSGERLYIDIIETNPPFTVWLYYPAVTLAHTLSVGPELVVAAFAYLSGGIGLFLTYVICSRAGFWRSNSSWWFWPSLAAVYFIMPGNVFAQREHIGFMLFIPFLVLQAWRGAEGRNGEIPITIAVFAGLCGSVMLLVKPHWALAIVLPAAFVAWKQRSLFSLFRAEFWVIGAIALGYLLAVLVLYPEFFGTVFPIVKQVYLPINHGSAAWPIFLGKFGILLMLALYVRMKATTTIVPDVIAISSVGFFIGAYSMGKWWDYHLYPSMAAVVVALLAASVSVAKSGLLSARFLWLVPVFGVAFALAALGNHTQARRLNDQLIASINEKFDQPKVAVISHDIALGFPFTRQVGGSWGSIYCSDWAGAYALFRLVNEEKTLDAQERAWLDSFLHDFVVTKTKEFREQKPNLVLEDNSSFWTRYLRTHEAFSKVMTGYERLSENDNVIVWKRKTDLASAK